MPKHVDDFDEKCPQGMTSTQAYRRHVEKRPRTSRNEQKRRRMNQDGNNHARHDKRQSIWTRFLLRKRVHSFNVLDAVCTHELWAHPIIVNGTFALKLVARKQLVVLHELNMPDKFAKPLVPNFTLMVNL